MLLSNHGGKILGLHLCGQKSAMRNILLGDRAR
jgi:hypothetical protein